MSHKLSNAPIYYALAQAQFNPVAAMGKYVEEVQDRLRRQGYPLFETRQVTHLQFAAAPGQAPTDPQVAHTTSWLITKADRSAGFILQPSSILYHTTHYDTRETFIPELLRGLRAVHEAVTLDHVGRLGLRYLDAVLPRDGEAIEQYLAPGLQGLSFGPKQRYALYESVYDTESGPLVGRGTLVVRVHRVTAPVGFPPDLGPSELVLGPKFATTGVRSHAVIDMDHFVEERMPLDLDRLGEQLKAQYATLKGGFRATVTDHAFSVWS